MMSTALTALAAGSSIWPMYNGDSTGSRYNVNEKKLGTSNVASLGVLWQFNTATVVTGTPVVSDGMVFAAEAGGGGGFGGTGGTIYALNVNNGAVIWKTTIPDSTFTATATVMRGRVVIGDAANGNIYGLDEASGNLKWTLRPNTSGKPAIWGSGTVIGNFLAIGVASNEEIFPTTSFSSNGSVVLLDPVKGSVIWQTYMISSADYASGANGVSVWTTPTYDSSTNTIYIGTGNNFTPPATTNSDALIALNAGTGAIKWVTQLYPNDTWNPWPGQNFTLGPDFDFGDSPQIYTLPNGRKVVGAGQKSGVYHVLDAATGQALDSTQLTSGSTLGGLFSDSAVANGIVYANANSYFVPGSSGSALLAFSADNNGHPTVLWTFMPNSFYALSGVSVANGVVYFNSVFDPNLYALNAATGQVLATVNIGNSNSGPSISNGQVFVGTGSVFDGGFTIPGTITSLGIK